LLEKYGVDGTGKPQKRIPHSHDHGCGHDHAGDHERTSVKSNSDLNDNCCDDLLELLEKGQSHVCLLSEDTAFQAKLKKGDSAFRKLRCVLIICVFFMISEIVGGIMSNSLAILTDAAHMCSDIGGFLISMISIWIGQKAPSSK